MVQVGLIEFGIFTDQDCHQLMLLPIQKLDVHLNNQLRFTLRYRHCPDQAVIKPQSLSVLVRPDVVFYCLANDTPLKFSRYIFSHINALIQLLLQPYFLVDHLQIPVLFDFDD